MNLCELIRNILLEAVNEISMWSYEIRITCYDLLSNYTKGYRHAYIVYILHIVVVQSLSHVPLFATP